MAEGSPNTGSAEARVHWMEGVRLKKCAAPAAETEGIAGAERREEREGRRKEKKEGGKDGREQGKNNWKG